MAAPVTEQLEPRFRLSRGALFGVVAAALVVIALGVVYVTQVAPSSYQSDYVVRFAPDASEAQKQAARDACPGAGSVVQQPASTDGLAQDRVYPLRYTVTDASPRERADLVRCLDTQPGVSGFSEVREN